MLFGFSLFFLLIKMFVIPNALDSCNRSESTRKAIHEPFDVTSFYCCRCFYRDCSCFANVFCIIIALVTFAANLCDCHTFFDRCLFLLSLAIDVVFVGYLMVVAMFSQFGNHNLSSRYTIHSHIGARAFQKCLNQITTITIVTITNR